MSFYAPLPNNILKLSFKCSKFVVRTVKTFQSLKSGFTLVHSANARLNKNIVDRYMCLPTPECSCVVEYIWIDGTGYNLRSKARTLDFIPDNHKEIPTWTFNGIAASQSVGKECDILLQPVAMYNDPFRRSNNKLILCDAYEFDGKPLPTNHRKSCAEAMSKVCEHEPTWGLQQQYHLMDVDDRPLGWPVIHGEPQTNGGYYCGVGGSKACGREIAESHYKAALYAGVQVAGINPLRNLSQWEFRIGICPGIKGADDLWMGRYILGRVAEEYGANVSYVPQLFKNWGGSACYINLSTKATRADNGLSALETLIQKLSKRHAEHLKKYDPQSGEENKHRLTGKNGTSSVETFSNGVDDRSVSVLIKKLIQSKKKGYFQDRRPGANCDPYAACDIIVRTCLLDEC